MKLQFDGTQPFQLDAIAAVVDLFDGQPRSEPGYAPLRLTDYGPMFAGRVQTELGVGNHLILDEARLARNARAVQLRNDIEVADEHAPLSGWEMFDVPANMARRCPHFSVEMETGTGKTYVYLRTIRELAKRYGFLKFVIVVPSVAIREGVLKNLEITHEHFETLFDRQPCASGNTSKPASQEHLKTGQSSVRGEGWCSGEPSRCKRLEEPPALLSSTLFSRPGAAPRAKLGARRQSQIADLRWPAPAMKSRERRAWRAQRADPTEGRARSSRGSRRRGAYSAELEDLPTFVRQLRGPHLSTCA